MAGKTEELLRRQKEAKQKKLLFILAPVLLILLVWQGPKTLKAFSGGGGSTPLPAATTTAAPTDPSVAPPPSTAAPGGAPALPADGLPESDPPAPALDGQLISFSRFVGKDPFRQQSPSGTPAPEGSDGSGESDSEPSNTAVVEVNGNSENVEVGDEFPASDPVFRLVSIEDQTAKVGLVSGSFSNGDETIDVNVGETFVLVSDPDGTRYAIKLVSVAFVEPS